MRAVNLLPVKAPRARGPRSALKRLATLAGVATVALVAVALVLSYTGAQASIRDRQVTLAGLNVQLAAAAPPRRQLSTAEQQLASEQAPRISALNAVLVNRVAWDRVLERLALVLPDDVWLTSLSAAHAAPTAPVAAGATTTAPAAAGSGSCGSSGVCITGYTYSQASVARLLARLAVVPAFGNVQLVSSVLAKLGTRRVYEFTVNTSLMGLG